MQEKIITYDPALLGFVIDVSPKFLEETKKELIDAVMDMELNERAYIYSCDNDKIPDTAGKSVAKISTYSPDDNFRLDQAVLDTLYLLSEEDIFAVKYMFVITDNEKVRKQYFKRVISLDLEDDLGFSFLFIGIGEHKFELFPVLGQELKHTKYQFVQQKTPTNIKDRILSLYRNDQERTKWQKK